MSSSSWSGKFLRNLACASEPSRLGDTELRELERLDVRLRLRLPDRFGDLDDLDDLETDDFDDFVRLGERDPDLREQDLDLDLDFDVEDEAELVCVRAKTVLMTPIFRFCFSLRRDGDIDLFRGGETNLHRGGERDLRLAGERDLRLGDLGELGETGERVQPGVVLCLVMLRIL